MIVKYSQSWRIKNIEIPHTNVIVATPRMSFDWGFIYPLSVVAWSTIFIASGYNDDGLVACPSVPDSCEE